MRSARAVGALGLLVFVAISCGPSAAPLPQGPPPEDSPGAALMKLTLASVREAALLADPFLGRRRLLAGRVELEKLGPEAPEVERVTLERNLAGEELRFGENAQAVRRLEAARKRRAAARVPSHDPHTYLLALELGVAHMRLAEQSNCAECTDGSSCIFPLDESGVHEDPSGARAAAALFLEAARLRPGDLRSRWLLNVAHMALGSHPAGVAADLRIGREAFAAHEEFPRFENVARELKLDAVECAGGVVVEDFDGDELLDVMTSTWTPDGQIRVYRNRGDGTFEDRTASSGLTGILGGLNLIHADYDNDGDADVLALRGAWLREQGHVPNSLLRNDGNFRFSDVTYEAGLAKESHPTQTADWADYDNDGDLDLYVGNEAYAPGRGASQLFRNDGDGTFTDVAAEAGVQNDRFAKSVVWGDYDNDGFMDLYVSNMGAANRLYRNQTDGTFADVAATAGVLAPRQSFPAWFWDFDNDGHLDLYVSSYAVDFDSGVYAANGVVSPLETTTRLALKMPAQGEPARLYRGTGDGRFRSVADGSSIGVPGFTMGANFGDLDQDGYLDFCLGTGDPSYETLIPNLMYRNREGRGFSDVTTAAGFGHLQKGHAIAFADLDNDGDQDVFHQLGGAFPADAFANAVFRNPGFDRRWLTLRLVGVRSNRSAIGARVRVDVERDGTRRAIHRVVDTGGSFGSNPLRLEIGLGDASRIAGVSVTWPGSGVVQHYDDLEMDTFYRLVEGEKPVLVEPSRAD